MVECVKSKFHQFHQFENFRRVFLRIGARQSVKIGVDDFTDEILSYLNFISKIKFHLFSVGYKIRFRKVARNCFRSSSGNAAKRCMNCHDPESTDGVGGLIISSPSPFSSHDRGTPNVWHIY